MCCSQNPSDQLVVRNPRNPCAAPRFDDGKGLQGISCIECGARVSAADAARLLKAEEILEARKNTCFLRLQPPKQGDFSGGFQVVKFPGLFQAELRKLDASLEERRSIQKVLQIAQKAQNHHVFYDVLCGTTMPNNEIPCVMPRR